MSKESSTSMKNLNKQLNIPEKCYEIIKRSLLETGFIGEISKENITDLIRHYLDVRRFDEQLQVLQQFGALKGKFLEVGSGFGGLVTYLNKRFGPDILSFGIEPAKDAYSGTIACTRVLSDANGIESRFISAIGEKLPFKSNTFDFVYSTSVLEHVEDPEKVVAESIRVLKKGGILQMVIPNYGSWWEGHYGVLMLPNMPKTLMKIYVRILGRNPDFVNVLQFITRKKLEHILAKVSGNVEILSWGTDTWEYRMHTLNFSDWASLYRLKRWVQLLHKIKIISFVIWLGKKFQWETPIILTLKKL